MKEQLIKWVIAMLFERISAEQLNKWVGMGLNMLKEKVKESPNPYDDMVVLPMIDVVEKAFSIKD